MEKSRDIDQIEPNVFVLYSPLAKAAVSIKVLSWKLQEQDE